VEKNHWEHKLDWGKHPASGGVSETAKPSDCEQEEKEGQSIKKRE